MIMLYLFVLDYQGLLARKLAAFLLDKLATKINQSLCGFGSAICAQPMLKCFWGLSLHKLPL